MVGCLNDKMMYALWRTGIRIILMSHFRFFRKLETVGLGKENLLLMRKEMWLFQKLRL